MTITMNREGSSLHVSLEGRLDTNTAPELEAKLKPELNTLTELEMDLKELEYVSSAGLRIILSAQKVMNRQGDMVLRNVNDAVMEVFEVTGLVDILTIE